MRLPRLHIRPGGSLELVQLPVCSCGNCSYGDNRMVCSCGGAMPNKYELNRMKIWYRDGRGPELFLQYPFVHEAMK